MRRPTGICRTTDPSVFIVTCDDGTVWSYTACDGYKTDVWSHIADVPQPSEPETPKQIRVRDWSPST